MRRDLRLRQRAVRRDHACRGAVLGPLGYEPREEDGAITLGNCPFDRLAADHRDLVCGVNAAFLGALARELGRADLGVRSREPGDGCCVRLGP